jgi:hypothetical protein
MAAPVEAKVTAGSLSAAAAGVVLWALQTYVFKNGMPAGAESLVYLLVPAIIAGAGAYLAPHTHRPDLLPPLVSPPSPAAPPLPPAGPVA